jgi:hypothetical protein
MLPGIRFLFAAIALSVSVLIFGLGAAALLRAAHEEFASNSSWRAAPEPPMLAQKADAPQQVLAMLQVQPQRETAPPTATDAPPIGAIVRASPARSVPAEPEAVASPATETEKVAALAPQDAPAPAETSKTDTPPAAETSANEAAPASAPALAAETNIATTEDAKQEGKPQPSDAPAPATDAASLDTTEMAKSEAANTGVAKSEGAESEANKPQSAQCEPAKSQSQVAPAATTTATSTKIASLGDASSAKEQAAPKQDTGDKAERVIDKERLRAERRARARRRLAAQRARLAREAAAQQQQLGLFAQQPIAARTP